MMYPNVFLDWERDEIVSIVYNYPSSLWETGGFYICSQNCRKYEEYFVLYFLATDVSNQRMRHDKFLEVI
jgi:hypothetical protein